jgi:hypothetical protein
MILGEVEPNELSVYVKEGKGASYSNKESHFFAADV